MTENADAHTPATRPARPSILADPRRFDRTAVFFIVLLAGLIFLPILGYDFINYDDNRYITDNPVTLEGLTWEGLASAFLEPHNSSWQPLAMMTHMVDVELFGLNGGLHHLGNLVLHLANSVLLYAALVLLTGQRVPSVFVALLFAAHPLHVEPVAWISSRKDVLSTFFLFLTFIVYARYARTHTWLAYGGVCALYVVGLLSKPMVITLPPLLLLLDYWPLKRIASLRDVGRMFAEKIPLFVICALGIAATLYFQSAGGAVKSAEEYPLEQRAPASVYAYYQYVVKTLAPHDLAILYPHPQDRLEASQFALAAVVIGGLTLLAVASLRRWPFVFVGWFWFVGTLVPVAGVVQFGGHFMADRYTYISIVGLFIAAVWSARALIEARPNLTTPVAFTGALLTAGYAAAASFYVPVWQNSITVFEQCVAATETNPLAHNNLGRAYQDARRYPAAIEQYEKALEMLPGLYIARSNLGMVLLQEAKFAEAETHLQEALDHTDTDPRVWTNLAISYAGRGQYAKAEETFRNAVELAPDYVPARFNLAMVLREQGKIDACRKTLEKVLEINPNHQSAYEMLLNLSKE